MALPWVIKPIREGLEMEHKTKNENKEKPKVIIVHGKEWFDKVNGNSYHSVVVTVDDKNYSLPFAYGYGSMYEQRAGNLLKETGILPEKSCLYSQCEKLGIIYKSFIETGCKKRDVVKWGEN